MQYFDGDVYEGQFLEGLPEGKGGMKYGDGDIYLGYFKKG
jgi:hypothetical protein